MALVLDTGPILALLDASDPAHRRCVTLIDQINETLVVPPMVLVEVDYWVHKLLGPETWRVLTEDIARGAYLLADFTVQDLERAADLEATYADLDLGLVDASVIALCERMGEGKVATLDRRDFSVVQTRVGPLHLLPD